MGKWEAVGVWSGGLLECGLWVLDLGSGCQLGVAGLSFGALLGGGSESPLAMPSVPLTTSITVWC